MSLNSFRAVHVPTLAPCHLNKSTCTPSIQRFITSLQLKQKTLWFSGNRAIKSGNTRVSKVMMNILTSQSGTLSIPEQTKSYHSTRGRGSQNLVCFIWYNQTNALMIMTVTAFLSLSFVLADRVKQHHYIQKASTR